MRNGLFNSDLSNKIYANAKKELCVVLTWNDDDRKIIIFDLNDLDTYEEENFLQNLHRSREDLLKIFNDIITI